MAETVVSDAARVPQDEGFPNISDGNEAWNSAGLMALLGQAAQSGSYVRSDSELDFGNHNGTNDTVDVTAGVAYLSLAGVTVDVQSTVGGSSSPAYDTTITTNTMPAVCVVLPTATTVDVQDSTLSSVWLAYDTDGTGPGGSAGDVYLRSDDTGNITAPSHPNVKLGEVNPDNASADTLENRFGTPTFNGATMAGDVVPASASSPQLGTSTTPWPAIVTEEGDITGETYIEATRSDNSTGNSSGDWVNVVDTEETDNRDELNASQQFVPEKSGRYRITCNAQVYDSTSGDLVQLRVRDVDAGDNVELENIHRTMPADIGYFGPVMTADVTAGNAHEIQVTNNNSGFNVGSDDCWLVIERMLVHP